MQTGKLWSYINHLVGLPLLVYVIVHGAIGCLNDDRQESISPKEGGLEIQCRMNAVVIGLDSVLLARDQ